MCLCKISYAALRSRFNNDSGTGIIPRPSVIPRLISSIRSNSCSNISIRLLIWSITSSIPRVIFCNLPVLLFLLSAILVNSLQIYAEPTIFFSAGDVVFAESSSGFIAGEYVDFIRPDGKISGKGEIFRVREEHIAVKVISGTPHRRDIIRKSDVENLSIVPNKPVDNKESIIRDEFVTSSGANIIVYGIRNAPKILSTKFDSVFIESLTDTNGVLDNNMSVIHLPPQKTASVQLIKREAKKHNAHLVIRPEYKHSADGDSIAVSIISGKTGVIITTFSYPVKPIEALMFLPTSQRTGRLEVIGKYTGISESVDGMDIDRDGDLLILIKGDLFRIKNGAVNYERKSRRLNLNRTAKTRFDGEVYEVEAVQSKDSITSGDIIRIIKDGEILYSSGVYTSIKGIAVRKGLIAILSENEIELVRIK